MHKCGPATRIVQLELLGSRVDVVVSGSGAPALEQAIRRAWDRCLAIEVAAAPRFVVEVVHDQEPAALESAWARGVLADHDEFRLMSSLTSALTLKAIESGHGELLMLHACAMADPITGSTVVLMAPSGTGKTTAATTLGLQLRYLTDETTAIDSGDRVIPYPKPLSILVDGRPPKRQTSPTALGLLPALPTNRVAAIALLSRVDRPAAPSVDYVPVMEALAMIAEQSSALQLLPRPLHRVADLLQRTGGLRRITYHDIGEATPHVVEMARGIPR